MDPTWQSGWSALAALSGGEGLRDGPTLFQLPQLLSASRWLRTSASSACPCPCFLERRTWPSSA
eukprot:9203998-Lingulodinium_polyedra.AAC.1